MPTKFTEEYAYSIFRKYGFEPLEPYVNCTDNMKCLNQDGYYIDISLDDIKSGKHGRPFSTYNRYTIDNIKIFINKDTNGEYEYVSGDYKNARSLITVRHKRCGREYSAKWVNLNRKPSEKDVNRRGTRCPFCEAQQLESTHALVLKQIWQHEKPDTVTEDKSCINPETNYPLPTDIVNHREKIAIEVQSWFHDFPDQQKKDKIKKEYWLNRGYQFYDIDQRDYTVLQMVQLFFPYIENIPDYIDFEYANKANDVKIQKLLNDGKKPHEIAKILNYNVHAVYDAIGNGRCEYPKNYEYECYHAVVQLDLNRDFVARYKSIADAKRATGLKSIGSCLFDKRNYCGCYYWLYEEDYQDYMNRKYQFVGNSIERYNKPVFQCDMNGNIIKRFNNYFEASKETNIAPRDIERVVLGVRKSAKHYKWKYAET